MTDTADDLGKLRIRHAVLCNGSDLIIIFLTSHCLDVDAGIAGGGLDSGILAIDRGGTVNLILDRTFNALPGHLRLVDLFVCDNTHHRLRQTNGTADDLRKCGIRPTILRNRSDFVIILLTSHCLDIGAGIAGGGLDSGVLTIDRSGAINLVLDRTFNTLPGHHGLVDRLVYGNRHHRTGKIAGTFYNLRLLRNYLTLCIQRNDLVVEGFAGLNGIINTDRVSGSQNSFVLAVFLGGTKDTVLRCSCDRIPGQFDLTGLFNVTHSHNRCYCITTGAIAIDHIMAQCRHLICNIAIAALAGIGGIAGFDTGRLGYIGVMDMHAVCIGRAALTDNRCFCNRFLRKSLLFRNFFRGFFNELHLILTTALNNIADLFITGNGKNRTGNHGNDQAHGQEKCNNSICHVILS